MRTLEQAGELKGKKVLLRADLDVPVAGGVIQDEYRIARQKECIGKLLAGGARVVMMAHIKSMDSFAPLKEQFERVLGIEMSFCKDLDEVVGFLNGGGALALMENLRMDSGEEANDPTFAARLCAGFDIYVNNAFAVCHREHASVVRAPKLLPSFAGPLIEQETAQLSKVIDAPADGKVIYMAGAKASTKVPVIRNLIDRAEHIAVGGVIANDIFKVMGRDIEGSRFDENAAELLGGLDLSDSRLLVPVDQVVEDGQYFDIGPQTSGEYAALAADAKLIVWNGPMGVFEDDRFMAGTKAIAEAVAASSATKIIGGGDTVSAIDKLGLLDKMDFVSTGGGAMLQFLAGQKLPGLEALDYYA